MARRTAHQRGYDHRWRKERAAFLAVNPWCVTLGEGCTRLATVVDHRIPHRGDAVLFWDRGNWQPLCAHCHDVWKARIEAQGPQRDHRGRLIL
jgi:5-methylcytosine-specific restriction endonuclease McrA